MSDGFEEQIRTLIARRMESVTAERVERVKGRARGARDHRLPLLPTATVGVATLIAVSGVAVLSLSRNAGQAFAGWTSTPAPASASAVTAARRACGHVSAADVLASEARGPYTAIVFVARDRPRQCVVQSRRVLLNVSTRYPLRAYAKVPAGKAMLPVITQQTFGKTTVRLNHLQNRYQSAASGTDGAYALPNRLLREIAATESGPGSMSAAMGIVGKNVTGVTVILKDGDRVQATVMNGWYVAWWPGSATPGGGEARRVAVGSTSGMRTAALPPLVLLGDSKALHGCVIGAKCSPLVPVQAAPVIARALTRSFAMFHRTRPVKESAAPAIVRSTLWRWNAFGRTSGSYLFEAIAMSNGNSAGLDPDQLRRLKLGPRITFWFIPGSQEFCQARAQGGSGGGSCGPVSTALRYGVIDSPGTVTVHGVQRYVIGGWVPNGNRTIRIKLASGRTVAITVRHNGFVTYLTSPPTRLIFRDGFGRLVDRPAPMPNEV